VRGRCKSGILFIDRPDRALHGGTTFILTVGQRRSVHYGGRDS